MSDAHKEQSHNIKTGMSVYLQLCGGVRFEEDIIDETEIVCSLLPYARSPSLFLSQR